MKDGGHVGNIDTKVYEFYLKMIYFYQKLNFSKIFKIINII